MHMHFSLSCCEIRTTQCSLIPKSKYVGKVISLLDVHVVEWYIRVYCALKLMHCCLFLTNMQFHMGMSGSIYLIIWDWRGFTSALNRRHCPTLPHGEWSYPLTCQWNFCTWALWMSYACFSTRVLMQVCDVKLNRLRSLTPEAEGYWNMNSIVKVAKPIS